ncbi:MAG: TlpA family protein disulfide reductase [Rhodocyclales bacterium]|nr:TlpA family protein disulfide reductase [Rhodocyclales bacterium]
MRSPARRRAIGGGFAALALLACGRAPEPPGQGAPFPAFALPAPDGTLHESREYAGRPLLINFWATWCPPCRAEMADLDALRRSLAPKGLQVLAISVDADRNLVREYLRRTTPGFTVLIDTDRQWSAAALGLPGLPTTYLVDRAGLIRAAWVGARPWAEPTVQADIAARVGLD